MTARADRHRAEASALTVDDRELIEAARGHEALLADYAVMLERADDIALNVLGNDLRDVQATIQSLLSDRDKLELRVRELEAANIRFGQWQRVDFGSTDNG